MKNKIADLLIKLSQLIRPSIDNELTPFKKQYNIGQVEPVFESMGVTYYRFSDERDLITKRGLKYLDTINELEYRVSRDNLITAFEGVMNLINEGNIAGVVVLIEEVKKRLDYITNVDLLYKIASILYFDENEDPRDYNEVYNAKKINKWKEDKEIDAFFLRMPIKELVPFGQLSEVQMTLKEYSVLEQKDQKIFHNVLENAIRTNKI